jgi:hypothetical protein
VVVRLVDISANILSKINYFKWSDSLNNKSELTNLRNADFRVIFTLNLNGSERIWMNL